MLFNAKNGDDRLRFMADVRESVAESEEMERLRLDIELDKHNSTGGNGLLSLLPALQLPVCKQDRVARPRVISNVCDNSTRESGRFSIEHSHQPSTSSISSGTNPTDELSHTPSLCNDNGTSSSNNNKSTIGVQTVVSHSAREGTGGSNETGIVGGVHANGGVNAAGAVVNGRRLSFNSLDSGMVEEGADLST